MSKKHTIAPTIAVRFWSKVDKRGPFAIINGRRSRCWLWTAALHDQGYGLFWLDGRLRYAHAVAREWATGEVVRDPLVHDHLCRRRNCIRPTHTEPVTEQVNIAVRGVGPSARNYHKETCPKGHTYTLRCGRRRCLECEREYMKTYNPQYYKSHRGAKANA